MGLSGRAAPQPAPVRYSRLCNMHPICAKQLSQFTHSPFYNVYKFRHHVTSVGLLPLTVSCCVTSETKRISLLKKKYNFHADPQTGHITFNRQFYRKFHSTRSSESVKAAFIAIVCDKSASNSPDGEMKPVLPLTWRVSFQSAGEFLGAPGRSWLGRCSCPPAPACWACFVV